MSPLPYKVTISGVENCLKASGWCDTHINKNNWNISMPFIGQAKYQFQFAQEEEASWFKLKWQ